MDNRFLATGAISVAVSILCILGFVYKANQTYLANVGTVDLRTLLVEQQEQVSTKYKMATEDGLKLAAQLAVKLDQAVADVAERCDCVLINQEAVIGGRTTDYTDEVRQLLSNGPTK